MLKINYIGAIIPIQFDFEMYGITTEEDKEKFLQKACEDSINMPIMQGDKPIGVITDCKISKTKRGLIAHGKINCNIEPELMKTELGYSLNAVVLSERKQRR